MRILIVHFFSFCLAHALSRRLHPCLSRPVLTQCQFHKNIDFRGWSSVWSLIIADYEEVSVGYRINRPVIYTRGGARDD